MNRRALHMPVSCVNGTCCAALESHQLTKDCCSHHTPGAADRHRDDAQELLTLVEGVSKWCHSGHGCFPIEQCGVCAPVVKALEKYR